MQLGKYALGERPADARHARQIVDARGLHALEATEVCKQCLPPLASNAPDLLQHGGRARLAASRSVSLDGEAVRLVTDLLQQMQTGMIRRQVQRLASIGKDDLLQPGLALGALSDADELRRVQALLRQHFGCNANLTFPAVDDEQIRRGKFSRDDARD